MAITALKAIARTPEKRDPEKLYAEAQRIIADNKPNPKGELPTFTKKTSLVLMHYWLAAEQGHSEAMKEIADMYFYGKRYFVRDGEPDKTTGGMSSNYTRALDYYQQLAHQGIDCPELETCEELYLIELKDRRERRKKKEHEDARRANRSTNAVPVRVKSASKK